MNKCECNKCGAKRCGEPCCGIPKPVFEVQSLVDDPLTLSFNFDGLGTTYDYRTLVKTGETDTTLSANPIARVLEYMAEKHTDTISAKELGAILHLTDIGDIDVSGVEDHSMLVYKKDSDCAHGCDDTMNTWVAWNALDHIVDSLQYIMGFDANGAQKSLSSPSSPSQQYLLGWNGDGKVGWTQIKTAAAVPTNAYQVYWDDTAKEFVKVKVN